MSPESVAGTTFSQAFRGYDADQVRAFQQRVAELLRAAATREAELRTQLEAAEARAAEPPPFDEDQVAATLGEEATRILVTAREAAAEIRGKAEHGAAELVREAQDDATRVRREADEVLAARRAEAEAAAAVVRQMADEESTRKLTDAERRLADAVAEAERLRLEASEEAGRIRSDADLEAAAVLAGAREVGEAEVEEGRRRGREAVAEAQVVRERVLADLARKRKAARIHLVQLRAGRDRLLLAYDVVRRTLAEATGELEGVLSEAKQAAGAAARRVETEADSVEAIEAELAAGRTLNVPLLADIDAEVAQSVFAVDAEAEPDTAAEAPAGEVDAEQAEPDAAESDDVSGNGAGPVPASDLDPEPIHLPPRRDRRGLFRHRRPNQLPEGELVPVPPSDPVEEVRVVRDEHEDDLAATGELDVHELFERIKAEEAEAEEPAVATAEAEGEPDETEETEETEETDETEPVAEESPAEVEEESADEPTADEALLTRRDAALGDLEHRLARTLKRVLADEQNEVLDGLRRQSAAGSQVTVDTLLAKPAVHLRHYADAARPELTEAAAGGLFFLGGNGAAPKAAVDDLAHEVATSIAERVRERLAVVVHEADNDEDSMVDGIRACYREWKAQHIDAAARHAVTAAFARGVFEAIPARASVRWIGDDGGGAVCPDCEDNALAGAIEKSADFPTGHAWPPAHPGCRCLVVPAE